jgi:hypothetical protein
MAQAFVRLLAASLICVSLTPANAAGPPRHHAALDGLGTDAKTTLVVAALIAAAAAIGVGVYLAVRQGHTVKGCVAAGGGGLELQTESGQSFVLLGARAGIKAGDRIKVTGSRKKRVSGVSEKQSFVVEKLDKDYGVCTVAPARP